MPEYIVNINARSTGEHEVHMLLNCTRLPDPENKKSIGYHDNCQDAVTEAKKIFGNVDGCAICCPACNTR